MHLNANGWYQCFINKTLMRMRLEIAIENNTTVEKEGEGALS
jgi:hypothetical protein